MFCKYCGNEIPNDVDTCPNCANSAIVQPQSEIQTRKKPKKHFFIIATSIFALCCAVAVLLLICHKKSIDKLSLHDQVKIGMSYKDVKRALTSHDIEFHEDFSENKITYFESRFVGIELSDSFEVTYKFENNKLSDISFLIIFITHPLPNYTELVDNCIQFYGIEESKAAQSDNITLMTSSSKSEKLLISLHRGEGQHANGLLFLREQKQ